MSDRTERNVWFMDPNSNVPYDVTQSVAVFNRKVATMSHALIPVGSDGLVQVFSVNADRFGGFIQNVGSADAALTGASAILASSGFRLQPGEKFDVGQPCIFTGAIFGVTATGTVTLSRVEFFA